MVVCLTIGAPDELILPPEGILRMLPAHTCEACGSLWWWLEVVEGPGAGAACWLCCARGEGRCGPLLVPTLPCCCCCCCCLSRCCARQPPLLGTAFAAAELPGLAAFCSSSHLLNVGDAAANEWLRWGLGGGMHGGLEHDSSIAAVARERRMCGQMVTDTHTERTCQTDCSDKDLMTSQAVHASHPHPPNADHCSSLTAARLSCCDFNGMAPLPCGPQPCMSLKLCGANEMLSRGLACSCARCAAAHDSLVVEQIHAWHSIACDVDKALLVAKDRGPGSWVVQAQARVGHWASPFRVHFSPACGLLHASRPRPWPCAHVTKDSTTAFASVRTTADGFNSFTLRISAAIPTAHASHAQCKHLTANATTARNVCL